MTASPWAKFDPEILDKLEDQKLREQLVDIIRRIQEMLSVAKADGRYDDVHVMRLFMLGTALLGFTYKNPSISAMELKAVLQREWDESFLAVKGMVESIEKIRATEKEQAPS